MGAGLTYQQRFGDELAFQVAAVTKLTRNLLLAAAIPALSAVHATTSASAGGGVFASFAAGAANPAVLASQIPPFLVAFLGMSLLRSLGDAAFVRSDAGEGAEGKNSSRRWKTLVATVGNELGAKHCLGTAMAAVGLSTSAALVRGVGFAPFAVGAAGSAAVGGVGLASAVALSVALPVIRGSDNADAGAGDQGKKGEKGEEVGKKR